MEPVIREEIEPVVDRLEPGFRPEWGVGREIRRAPGPGHGPVARPNLVAVAPGQEEEPAAGGGRQARVVRKRPVETAQEDGPGRCAVRHPEVRALAVRAQVVQPIAGHKQPRNETRSLRLVEDPGSGDSSVGPPEVAVGRPAGPGAADEVEGATEEGRRGVEKERPHLDAGFRESEGPRGSSIGPPELWPGV